MGLFYFALSNRFLGHRITSGTDSGTHKGVATMARPTCDRVRPARLINSGFDLRAGVWRNTGPFDEFDDNRCATDNKVAFC